MASLQELINTVALCEGLDPASIAVTARAAREAGLISTGKRGRAPAQMSPEDATNLLIGVNGALSALTAPTAILKYRQARLYKVHDGILTDHIGKPGFGPFLESMIDAASKDTLDDFCRSVGAALEGATIGPKWVAPSSRPPKLILAKLEKFTVRIVFELPTPNVRVEIVGSRSTDKEDHVAEIAHLGFRADGGPRETANFERNNTDRTMAVRITDKTIRAVGKALGGLA